METIRKNVKKALEILCMNEQERWLNGYDSKDEQKAIDDITFAIDNLIEINKDLSKENHELRELIKDKIDEAKWEYVASRENIIDGDGGEYTHLFKCTKCGRIVSIDADENIIACKAKVYDLNPFCNCGARMKM